MGGSTATSFLFPVISETKKLAAKISTRAAQILHSGTGARKKESIMTYGMEAQIQAMNANTRAMEAYTAALREHTAALNNQAEETKQMRHFLERLTENYSTGGHVGVEETVDSLGRIAQMLHDSADKFEYASKRIADSSNNFRR